MDEHKQAVLLSNLEKEVIRFCIRVYLNVGSPAGMPTDKEQAIANRLLERMVRH